MNIKEFVFNPFQENTYVLYDETLECVIVDPGCYDAEEEKQLEGFITKNNLKPVALLNTHCHIDHIFGNQFVASKYNLQPLIHEKEVAMLDAGTAVAEMYGLVYYPSPEGLVQLKDNGEINFGNTGLKMIFAPGHSPGSICFYNENEEKLIGGDVLFQLSIGRTDLPGGDSIQLLKSINERLFTLPDDVIVFPGHGPQTTIGYEKMCNPFLTDTPSFSS
jgi:hydroxyacylglutathione hydrolase